MFFKKKCPNCGAKNPEALKACAICGAPFALRQMKEQLEGRKGPTPAWPKEVEKEAEMGSFDRLCELFRDHTRDRICARLRALGVDAQVNMSYRAAEENK